MNIAELCEAVTENEEPPLFAIYQAARLTGRDDYAATRYAVGPVEALEAWASEIGCTDYSIDTDDLRVVLCPAHSNLVYYVYRPREQ